MRRTERELQRSHSFLCRPPHNRDFDYLFSVRAEKQTRAGGSHTLCTFVRRAVPSCESAESIFCCFKSCKIQSFQQSLAAWEHTALAVEFAVTGVQTFNRIRGVNDFPHILRELKNRHDNIPVFYPAFHGGRIFGGPFFNNPLASFLSFVFGKRIVHSL